MTISRSESEEESNSGFKVVDNSFFGITYHVGPGGTTGELVILSSSDELVEGTFSFTADGGALGDSVVVTNGAFSALPWE